VEVRARSRADGRRNRELVLNVATQLFVENGPDVPFTEIAKKAGVGVGTVYRHFPTREELISAAYASELDAVCDAAGELLNQMPPAAALRAWMGRFIDYMTMKIGMSAAIRVVVAAGGNPYARSRERLDNALGALLAAAVADGSARPEVQADDVLLTLAGIAMAAGAPEQREQADRMVDLLIAGTVVR
jgi:AcrR family transcriptional regulator